MFKLAFSRAARLPTRSTQFARFYSNKLTAGSVVANYGSPNVRYTENHEWVAAFDDKNAFVGITKYAADALGDTTYVEVADVDTQVDKDESIGSVESVKSASDLYSPLTGTLVEANEGLVEDPTLVNKDPMGAAWFAKIKFSDPTELETLMTYEQYEAFLQQDK